MIDALVRKNRSCRRFYQNRPVDMETLKDIVNLGRLSASAANLQPLKYIISCKPETNAGIFPCLAWAGYLKNWPGPEEGERPAAYIIVLGDTTISKDFGCDAGIAIQSILLGAAERGLLGCIIGSIKRDRLRELLAIEPQFEILLTVALGKPKETIVIDQVGDDGSIRYWRDKDQVHHVPKRSLEDIILASC